MSPTDAYAWFAGLPLRFKLLRSRRSWSLVELALRRLAPKSRAYRPLEPLLRGDRRGRGPPSSSAVIYVVSVGPIGLVMRAFGHDPLDRRLAPEPSFWRAHEPNPLGPERAARHQF